ncbi:MAG: acyl carrier protein [Labilithrix sp.]|nr:acyl carrier protein [Labilithrix sp.]MCW5831049.1 acyl carrier protein [Labilithrix sp.]
MSDVEAEKKVRAFLLQRFPDAKRAGDDDSLLDMGVIDSLGILDVAEFLSSDLGLKVEDDDLVPEHFESIAALLRFVAARRSGSA